jgi:hypothetical protein
MTLMVLTKHYHFKHVPQTPAFGPSHRGTSLELSGCLSASSAGLEWYQSSPRAGEAVNSLPPPSPHLPLPPMSLGNSGLGAAPAVSGGASEFRVIIDEDPARDIFWPDDENEDNKPEVSGEGVGEEDAFIGGEEEDEEDRDFRETASVRATCPLPMWLKEDFERKVGESNMRGKDGLPPLYHDLGTFWFPRKSKFFVF